MSRRVKACWSCPAEEEDPVCEPSWLGMRGSPPGWEDISITVLSTLGRAQGQTSPLPYSDSYE